MLIFRKTKFLYRYNPMNLLKLCRMMSDYKKGELYYVEKIIPAVAVLSTITFSSVFAAPHLRLQLNKTAT